MSTLDERDRPQELTPACPYHHHAARWYAIYALRVLWALPWVLAALALLLFVGR